MCQLFDTPDTKVPVISIDSTHDELHTMLVPGLSDHRANVASVGREYNDGIAYAHFSPRVIGALDLIFPSCWDWNPALYLDYRIEFLAAWPDLSVPGHCDISA